MTQYNEKIAAPVLLNRLISYEHELMICSQVYTNEPNEDLTYY